MKKWTFQLLRGGRKEKRKKRGGSLEETVDLPSILQKWRKMVQLEGRKKRN